MAAATKKRTQRSIDGPSHVDSIDLVVRKGTLVPGVEKVATSWRCCLTAHHLDPEIQTAPHIITEKQIKDSREPMRNLILHAQEELESIPFGANGDHSVLAPRLRSRNGTERVAQKGADS